MRGGTIFFLKIGSNIADFSFAPLLLFEVSKNAPHLNKKKDRVVVQILVLCVSPLSLMEVRQVQE